MSDFSHLDEKGNARMVDVGDKDVTERTATAKGRIHLTPDTLARIRAGGIEKDLIPLCHPLPLSSVKVELSPADDGTAAIDITATCKVAARTGVEMEALTAVSIAALTIYDMCKALDRAMRITDIRLVHKSGGRSGTFIAPGEDGLGADGG